MQESKIFFGLDQDIKNDLIRQLSVLWTHDSTAIEGNTLTLGETDFLIREGMLVTNRPLKDCMEAKCHYDAIKFLYSSMYQKLGNLTPEDIKNLHKVMMPSSFSDSNMIGNWKSTPNATYINIQDQPVMLLYPLPKEIPALVETFILHLNRQIVSPDDALDAYCSLHLEFVSIHPFSDGNGRMARLLANLPLMSCGELPIIIPSSQRQQYIKIISAAQQTVPLKEKTGKPLRKMIIPDHFDIGEFKKFCIQQRKAVTDLVENARFLQSLRSKNTISPKL